jgi:hypothetical protein
MRHLIGAAVLAGLVVSVGALAQARGQAPQSEPWPDTFETAGGGTGQLFFSEGTFAAYVAGGRIAIIHAIAPADAVLDTSPDKNGPNKLSDREKQLIARLASAVDAASAPSYAVMDGRSRGFRNLQVDHHVRVSTLKSLTGNPEPVCRVHVSGKRTATGATAWDLEATRVENCFRSYQAQTDSIRAEAVAREESAAKARASARSDAENKMEQCRSAFKSASDKEASFGAALTKCRAVNRYMDTSAGNLEREAEAVYYVGQILENGFDGGRRKPNEARFQYRKCASLNPRCAAALIQVDAEIAEIIRKAVQSGDAKLAKGDSKGAQEKYWLALRYEDTASGWKLVELKRKEEPDKTRALDGILSIYEALAMAGSDKAVELFEVEIDRRKAVLRELYQEAVNVCKRKTYTQTTRPNGTFVGLSAGQQLDLCIEQASSSGEHRELEKRLGNIYALRRGSTGALFPDPVIDAN